MSVTLRIQVLFHWDSPAARTLATRLYRIFSAHPLGEGPRIPVRYGAKQAELGPPPVDLSAEREIIVVLVDKRMARRAKASDRIIADKWGETVGQLLHAHPPTSLSPHHVLPVALDAEALGLSPSLNGTSFVRVDARQGAERERHLVLHVAIRALRALKDLPQAGGQPVDSLPDIPVRLFISHAKADLPRDPATIAEGPVKSILAAATQLPLEGWYDAREIPPGGNFAQEILSGVLGSRAIVAILTDKWSSREWCRREALEAKLAGRPMVVVDAIEARVLRLFPYLGNAPLLRWRAAIVKSVNDNDAWNRRKALWEIEDAALVIEAALLEALRYQYEHRHLQPWVEPGDVALGAPPEALVLAHLPAGTKRIWYPDPPLGREELDRLRPAMGPGQAPGLEMTTPLRELARWKPLADVRTIAVSLSNAPDAEEYGGSPEHLATFADDLVLYLLVAGLRVAYGGVLDHGALQNDPVEGDAVNYVERLFSMVSSYATLLSDVLVKPLAPIENWVAWPIHLKYGDKELDHYGTKATLKDLGPPPDLDVDDAELNADASGFAFDTLPRRYAFARSLTFMRESMRDGVSARVAMGGKTNGFQGLWPGVLEEGLICLRAGQPLYLLGLFGGAGRVLLDALRGKPRKELTSEWFSQLNGMNALRMEYLGRGHVVQTPEELAGELKQLGARGLASALNNGLTDAENAALAESDSPRDIVTFILNGLRRKMSS